MHTILTVGIPNSGKTTAVHEYARKHIAAILSPDKLLLDEDGQYVWSPERAAQAWRKEYHDYGKLLRYRFAGTVIWDATFTSRITRCALVNVARAFGRVDAWFFGTPLDVCIQRNALRPPDRQVPVDKLKLFYDSLEAPTLDEGFHGIVRYSGLERIAA